MKISELIKELEKTKQLHGDIQVTCTHALNRINEGEWGADVYETTVENLEVHEHKKIGKCVRVWL